MKIDLSRMATENRNPKTIHLDSMSSLEIAQAMNREDQEVIKAVKRVLPKIAQVIDLAYKSLLNNGRVIYMGAGTSGRLGVLDASECPPTFNVKPGLFVGLIAGGNKALTTAIEGAEDKKELAKQDLKNLKLKKNDLIIGLAASGKTPYVIGGIEYAKQNKCRTASITCNKNTPISKLVDVAIEVIPGPEVLTGSTRLKAGTAQKLILNMISTGAMVKMGKCYQNLMVDVVPTNQKLHVRAENIVMAATNCKREKAKQVLSMCSNRPKVAIVMILKRCNVKIAEQLIQKAKGHIRNIE